MVQGKNSGGTRYVRRRHRRPTSAGGIPPLTSMSVDSGGPFGTGDFAEDSGPEDFGSEAFARGWMPPEDRLWRHPSELGPSSSAAVARRTSWRWPVLAAGIAGVAAASAVVVMTTNSKPGPVSATDASVALGPDVVKVVDTVEDSLVSLVPAGSSRPAAPITGIVLSGGNLVVTAAAPFVRGEHVRVQDAAGRRQQGVVEGVDDVAGVAVVQVPQRLSPGSFVDEEVAPRELAVTVCRCAVPTAGGPDGPEVALTMVSGTGMGGSATGSMMDAIEAEIPLQASAFGSVLLDDDGGVLGVLDGEQTTDGDTYGYFVPSALAVAVAQELARNHVVDRGWLGVMCEDDGGTGVMVTSVLPGSPAATAGLRPGDVVEAVDSHQIVSFADLEARLYASPPGTVLLLTVLRAGNVATMPVTVAAKPS